MSCLLLGTGQRRRRAASLRLSVGRVAKAVAGGMCAVFWESALSSRRRSRRAKVPWKRRNKRHARERTRPVQQVRGPRAKCKAGRPKVAMLELGGEGGEAISEQEGAWRYRDAGNGTKKDVGPSIYPNLENAERTGRNFFSWQATCSRVLRGKRHKRRPQERTFRTRFPYSLAGVSCVVPSKSLLGNRPCLPLRNASVVSGYPPTDLSQPLSSTCAVSFQLCFAPFPSADVHQSTCKQLFTARCLESLVTRVVLHLPSDAPL